MEEDIVNIKKKIIDIIRLQGPSLPLQISSKTNLSSIFVGAFLSELAKEKILKISEMKVGGSPLYFMLGQEPALDNFYQYLPGKEKEAFLSLKQKKILEDIKQEPAIRVALRFLKDFAFPFKNDEELWWRFHTIKPEEIIKIFESKKTKPQEKPKEIKKEAKKEIKEKKEEKIIKREIKNETLDIFTKPKNIEKKAKQKKSSSKNEKFFNRVKEFLTAKNIEIIDIINYTKTELTLLVKENNKEVLLIAYNKKRINDSDLLKAYKKASEKNLPYIILSLGETPKKLEEIIQASKNLTRIEKIS